MVRLRTFSQLCDEAEELKEEWGHRHREVRGRREDEKVDGEKLGASEDEIEDMSASETKRPRKRLRHLDLTADSFIE